MSILSTEAANIKLEVTGEDLRQFSEELIRRAVGEVADAMTALQGNDLLTKEKVKSMCGVWMLRCGTGTSATISNRCVWGQR